MVEGAAFRRNAQEALGWEQRYRIAAEEVDRNEARNVSIAPLRVDAALAPRRNFNYTTGM